jgi:hypothetical protein
VTHSWLLVVLSAFALARMARLVTSDAIFDRPRERIKRAGTKAALFITCPWCVSIWLAAGVVALIHFYPHWWFYAAAVFTFSEVAGLLAGHESA